MRRVVQGVPIRGPLPAGAASWKGFVKDKDLTAPPGGPTLDDSYIVSSPATGAWTGREDNIATWDGSQWTFETPAGGWAVWVEDEQDIYVYNGASWGMESMGPHAPTHQDGGVDEVGVGGLSGLLADQQTPLAHKTSHQDGGADEVATITPAAGAIPKADGTGKIPSGFIPPIIAAPHATTHQNGGGDEVNVGALSGLLADNQNPTAHATEHVDGTDDIRDATAALKGVATAAQITKLDGIDAGADVTSANPPQAHAASHENGGSDEVGVGALSGLLADPQTPLSHAASHKGGGADVIDVATPTVDGLMSAADKTKVDSLLPTEDNVSTTDATPTTIATVPIADNTAVMLIANIVGRRTNAGDRACYIRRVLVYREAAGAPVFQNTINTEFTRESVPLWNATFVVSGNDVLIQVTGRAGDNINWNVLYTAQVRG